MTTVNQRTANLIVNLKVVSQLEVDDRPIFKNGSVLIRKYYWIVTAMVRTIAGEDRDDVIIGLTHLMDEIDRLIDDYQRSPELQNHIPSAYDKKFASDVILSLNQLKGELPIIYNCEFKGLNAVKKTYEIDPVSASKIDGIITRAMLINRRIHILVEDLQSKYELSATEHTNTGLENKQKPKIGA